MHLAKQGVCVPAEHIFFSPAPPASLRDEGEQGGQGWLWVQTWWGVWAEVCHTWHREASLLTALSFGSASLGAVFHL